jgi:protein-S-isoprenylcysteine O-methyltransferase Ste14
MRPERAIGVLWVAFLVSWTVAAAWQRRTEKRAGAAVELRYRVVFVIGALLLAVSARGYGALAQPLWHLTDGEAWAGVAVIVIGIAFAWWARVHLGSLWSGTITRKKDHRVVESGPYAIVRHPIYTGILLAVFATAVEQGTGLALVAAALVTVGLWMKARLEESWLRQELGAAAYEAYRRRVPMLIPFAPTER